MARGLLILKPLLGLAILVGFAGATFLIRFDLFRRDLRRTKEQP